MIEKILRQFNTESVKACPALPDIANYAHQIVSLLEGDERGLLTEKTIQELLFDVGEGWLEDTGPKLIRAGAKAQLALCNRKKEEAVKQAKKEGREEVKIWLLNHACHIGRSERKYVHLGSDYCKQCKEWDKQQALSEAKEGE